MMTLPQNRLRKKKVTITTSKRPMYRVSFRLSSAHRMNSELSKTIAILTSLGSPLSISFNFSLIRSTTSTVFVPVCFCTATTTAGLPSP